MKNLITTQFIEDILFTLNHAAHLKDAKTGNYINTNYPHLKYYWNYGRCSGR